MNKTFNITADCKPGLHYMVDLHSRLEQIRGYVDRGEYLSINRARQYGKTTTLRALNEYLKDAYYVVGMDFQMQMCDAEFRSENAFSVAFAKAFVRILQNQGAAFPEKMKQELNRLQKATQENREDLELVELFQHLSDICRESDRPLVLIIDEADSAANHQVFLDFLAQLRGYYIDRDRSATFRSDEEHKRNRPWNIAVGFKVDMSFSTDEIAGFLEAERILLGEKNTLFESMVNKLYDFPELKDIVYFILFMGKECPYNALNEAIGTAEMFGFVKNGNGVLTIANRIFEVVFYNLFLTSAESQNMDI